MRNALPDLEQLNIQPVGKQAGEVAYLLSQDERTSADQTASEVVFA